jgi:DNA repair exonuclease SbcCD ATPase subunit
MILNSIKVTDYRQFKGEHLFTFDKITLVKGANGSGKSNLARKAPLLGLYGYRGSDNLDEIATRGLSKTCEIALNITKNNNTYEITRKIPTNVSIKVNNELVSFKEKNSTEAKEYISKYFHDADYFKKFRLIDAYDKDTNFLKDGTSTIKKILFSLYNDKINNIKQRLLTEKRLRENFCISQTAYKHYPSEKRLAVLKAGEQKYNILASKYNKTVRDLSYTKERLRSQIGALTERIEYARNQIEKTQTQDKCPSCWQTITQTMKTDIIVAKNQTIKESISSKNVLVREFNALNKEYAVAQRKYEKVLRIVSKIQTLMTKLQGRMRQKEYKYTEQDIITVKQALTTVDQFGSFYLTKTLSILKPIINSVLSKINHELDFIYTETGDFEIILKKNDGSLWKYKDLSTGQELMLQIAFKMALLLERGEEGLLIADEGFGALDADNLSHIITLIDSMPFQLVFILHNFTDVPSNIKVIDLNKRG